MLNEIKRIPRVGYALIQGDRPDAISIKRILDRIQVYNVHTEDVMKAIDACFTWSPRSVRRQDNANARGFAYLVRPLRDREEYEQILLRPIEEGDIAHA